MKGKKQDSENAKGALLANGWGTLESGVALPPKQGVLSKSWQNGAINKWKTIFHSLQS